MPQINIVWPGSTVRVGNDTDPVIATVTGAYIRAGGYVSYEVVWWDGPHRQEAVVEAHEIRTPLGDDGPFSRN